MRTLLLLTGSCLLLFGQLLAQTRTITGKVTDDKGMPLANVSVLIRGTKTGVSTGADGTYTIALTPAVKALVFSSIGFATVESSVGNKTAIDMILTTSADKDLQDVVVVGYGTTRKSDLTSSIAKVSGDKVANIPFSSVDQALQGKAAGLQSAGFSGQPGANQQVRIRGIGSYSASTQPLYVIDGIQINSGDLQNVVILSSTNVLAGLNPDDIESISVLKDAAATSIYGARGGNGVILINTKKGKAGKTQFNATAEVGNNRFGKLPDAAKPLNTKDWLALFQESYINAGNTAAQAATAAANYGDGSVNTDWLKLVTRTGQQQQYNISAQGGEGKTTFYVSGGYFKQQASTIGADLTRWSSLLKVDHQAGQKLSLSLSIQPSYTKQNGPLSNGSYFGNPVMNVFFLRPTQNPYNADGSLNINTNTTGFSSVYNPLYITKYNVHSNGQFSGIGNAQAKYSILDNLKFTSKMGVQYQTYNDYQYDNPLHGDGKAANGRGFSDYAQYFLTDWTNQLDYHFNLTSNKDLVADVKLGYESILSKAYFIQANAQNFPHVALDLSTIASTATAASATAADYSFASVYSNLTLNYKDKYILSGNFRRDGSSRFSTSNKYGNFPSVGLSWNVSKEDFLSDVKAVSNLKLRASYGSTGNAEIGNYAYLQQFGYGSMLNGTTVISLNYNGQPGGTFSVLGNSNLTWEKDNQADVGVDASFLAGRISIVADYYDKESSNLLFAKPLSQTTGFSNFTQNIGKMSNKGIEFTINATPVATKDFSWDISLNITYNKNQIKSLPTGQVQIINGQFFVAPGHDLNTWYMRQWAGVDPATGNPLWYTDSSKKATTTNYNAAARVNTGKSANPKYYGGLSNTFTYKGFSLSADLYYNFGNYIWDQWAFYMSDEVSPTYGKYALDLQRWQKAGDKTNVPKLVYNSSNFSSSTSTRFLYKGDYLRLRNVTLGYTLASSIARRLHLSSLRIYVRGTNLWTKTYDKNMTIDPEQGGSSSFAGNNGTTTSTTGTPNLNVFYNKAFTAGLSIGF
ncbi:MAG TPA: SusC/RagA family TonB-linked outer membrane protein [Puia sp.]|nr:SusC/RagA family TonB-linked outer membrane protein [Puia sp.]